MSRTDIYDNPDKLYTYLKSYFTALKYNDALKALTRTRQYHKGQLRKSGTPYLVHPLTMVSHAISMGLIDEDLLVCLLYHDVLEDCDEDIDNLGVTQRARTAIKLLTVDDQAKKKDKVAYYDKYYENIGNNLIATLGKLLDRANNVSTMSGVFSDAKLKEYVLETETYILPLIRRAKDMYPDYSNQLFLLKYHISSVLSAVSYACDLADRIAGSP